MRWIALAFVLLMNSAQGADFRVHGKGPVRVFVLEGEIERGDSKKFTDIVRANHKAVWPIVYLLSPGGDFEESMKLGRIFSALEMQTMVPDLGPTGPVCKTYDGDVEPTDPANCTCASACFFAHIGSVQRGGSYLLVHRPYYAKGRFGQLSEAEAKDVFSKLQVSARAYMKEMNVPPQIIEDVLATSSDRALLLDKKTINLYFTGFLPSRHEWLRNKCSALSAHEESRYEQYLERFLTRNGKSLDQVFSAEELADFEALAKNNTEASCVLRVMKEKRSAAYDSYFASP